MIIKIIVPIIYFTVSQSIGNDRTVDSHMLDEYVWNIIMNIL